MVRNFGKVTGGKIAALLAVVLSTSIGGHAALAQTAGTPAEAMAAAQNQLGILEYCKAQGHGSDKAIQIQKAAIAKLPASGNTAAAKSAYAKGLKGTVSAMGREGNLAAAAKAQGTDVGSLCTKISAAIEQAAQ